MKDIYRWFDKSYEHLKEMDKVVGDRIRGLKKEKSKLHDDLRNGRIEIEAFTKKQASLNRRIQNVLLISF